MGISDKLGKWFGLTASCRDRVYVRVRGERSRQGTRSGEQVVVGCWRPRPARDSEKRVWNAREGVVGMMRALDRRPQRPRALSALALRRPGLAGTLPLLTAGRRTVKKTFRLLNISTRRLVIIPKLLTRVVLSSSIRRDNRCRRLYHEKPYLDSQLIKHLYRYQSFHLVTDPIYVFSNYQS